MAYENDENWYVEPLLEACMRDADKNINIANIYISQTDDKTKSCPLYSEEIRSIILKLIYQIRDTKWATITEAFHHSFLNVSSGIFFLYLKKEMWQMPHITNCHDNFAMFYDSKYMRASTLQ